MMHLTVHVTHTYSKHHEVMVTPLTNSPLILQVTLFESHKNIFLHVIFFYVIHMRVGCSHKKQIINFKIAKFT